MLKNFFPIKLLLAPSETFAEIGSGRCGWGWPLGLYGAATAASALLITSVSPDFLARASSDLRLSGGQSFAGALAAGLPGGLAFNAFFGALLAAFAAFLAQGRLMLRLPVPAAAVAGYAFFFILRLDLAAGGAAGWLVRGAAGLCGVPGAKAFAAALPALLGAAAFAFSLYTLGLLSTEVFEMLLLL